MVTRYAKTTWKPPLVKQAGGGVVQDNESKKELKQKLANHSRYLGRTDETYFVETLITDWMEMNLDTAVGDYGSVKGLCEYLQQALMERRNNLRSMTKMMSDEITQFLADFKKV